MLCGLPLIVQQPSSFQCFLLEFSPIIENRLPSSAPDVFWCQIVQAFMVAPFVVMSHERADLLFKVAREIIVFQENTVFQGTVPAFDLALGHRVIWLAPSMAQL